MITRGRSISLTPTIEEFIHEKRGKRDTATNTIEQTGESCHEDPLEIVQAPVFNIHIHVPANTKGDPTKLYLPRIQPIIHLHFDELAKKLGKNNSHQKKELSLRYMKNVVSRASPRFGRVLIHNVSNSVNRDHTKNNICTSTPERDLQTNETSNIDLETNQRENIEMLEAHTSEIRNQSSCKNKNISHINSSCKSSSEVLLYGASGSDQPIRLKKAVVVLEDICKSKSLKDFACADLAKQQHDQVPSTSERSLLTDKINSDLQIKEEQTPSSSHANDGSDRLSLDNAVNSSDTVRQSELVNHSFSEEEKCNTSETLLSLTEGCNFSEILKRFRKKFRRTTDREDNSNALAKIKNILGRSNELEDRGDNVSVDFSQNSITVKQELCTEDELVNKQNCSSEKEETVNNEKRVNSQTGNSMCKLESCETGTHLNSGYCKNQIKDVVERSELNNSSSQTAQECQGLITGKNDIKCSVNQFLTTDFDSDDNGMITSSKVISKVVEDVGTEESDPINKASNLVIITEIDSVKLSEEEIDMTKFHQRSKKHEKRKQTPENESEKRPSPKKMKQSNEKEIDSEKETPVKSPVSEDYIPLNVSGPTKFSVAQLSNVKGYQTHSAKNFKNDMLFGNRVTRFSSSAHLDIYKMKKKSRRLQ